MSKTYRALAIVAVVATVVSIGAQVWFVHAVANDWIYYAPITRLGGLSTGLILAMTLTATTPLAAPMIATFSVVVAAQAQRWGWLVAFVLLGLFATYGAGAIGILAPYSHLERAIHALGLDTAQGLFPLAMLAIAALLFVVTARPRQPLAAVERAALPEQP